jgi:hypothetical protein
MAENNPASRVSTIKLDDATRKRILAELGIEGDIDWIPDTILVTRVHASALGITKPALAHPFVVMDC